MSIVSGKLIELASSTISQQAETVLSHCAKLGQHATLAKSRQRSGHKAIKETEKLFQLNPIEKKLKQTTTVANYRPETYPHHMSVNSTSAS